ncbi:endocellulase [Trametes versicolor FP-101664 SS1]|uniref:endocellulase n=1 Tax=Trametes versicolor (strain FP-101664) TaxID=717944 RepID=UPI00046249F7|nr:endocellulase [Trametes versicolor FP-101664 SS1]EIW52355.1 endocellulase [Trametes versicolor FP-101664 SS1]
MHFSTLFSVVAVAASACAQTTLSGQFTCAPAGAYTLCQNLWGESAGVGQQNSTLLSTNGNSVSWRTIWEWANGPNNVKSYANVEHNTAKGVQLSSLKSAPTAWQWEYESQSSGIRADVSYDIWTGTTPTGNPASAASSFEIMIWLSGKGGIQPVGSQVQSGISLAGHNWTLWKGPNANWEVLSFVSQDGDITNFNADLKKFFDFIQENYGVASSQFVQAIQTGTEPFVGSASLLINNFNVALNH